MIVLTGLGNPGPKYQDSRHNAGFMAIDDIAKRFCASPWTAKHKAHISNALVGGEKVLLVKPQTYMNQSGQSVREILNFYKVLPPQLFVFYDDIDLEIGRLRIRQKGSAGTHNGMKSIVSEIQSQDFPRFRIGVSKPPAGQDLADYVLSPFTKAQKELLQEVLEKACQAAEVAVSAGIDLAMNRYNVS